MINKIKLSLLVAVLSLAFVGASAYADDLTFSNDTSVLLSGPSITLTITAGSTATSIVVDSTTLTVTVPASSTFTLSSPNRFSLANNAGLTEVCSNSSNSVTVTGLATVVFTPSTTVCAGISGGGGLSSGGGSSSSSSSSSSSNTSTSTSTTTPTTITINPPTTVTPVTNIPGCGNSTTGFSTATGQSCATNNPNVVTPIPGCGGNTSGFSTSSGVSCAGNVGNASGQNGQSSYNFGTVTLKNGSRGDAVKELQRFLNNVLNLGLVVDGKLGPKTIAVIKVWQKAHGLVPDGLIGPKTKAMMNASVQG